MDKINAGLSVALTRREKGGIIMLELPSDGYFDANVETVKLLTGLGMGGVYVSFHRPFGNIVSILRKSGVDTGNLIFVDVAAALAKEDCPQEHNCVHLSGDVEVDELVRAIYTSLSRLKAGRKFIFMDSLTTITLYKPLSETMRFSEFLVRTVRTGEADYLILNVARDLAQKKFIRDIALRVDEVIAPEK